jgi:hypothetical protein
MKTGHLVIIATLLAFAVWASFGSPTLPHFSACLWDDLALLLLAIHGILWLTKLLLLTIIFGFCGK